jgi:hypothetical protein
VELPIGLLGSPLLLKQFESEFSLTERRNATPNVDGIEVMMPLEINIE